MTFRRIWPPIGGMGGLGGCLGTEIVAIIRPIGRLMKSAFRAIAAGANDRVHLAKIQDILEWATEDLERLG